MKNFNFDNVKDAAINVRCEKANVLNVVHALDSIYIGGSGIIDNDYNLGVPDDVPMIDVSNIKTCNDTVIALSDALDMDRKLFECSRIILIDVGGTDECRYLNEDQILWAIYSIEELKTINPTFWINIENLSAPGITGNDKHFNFSNRYQTLESLKSSIGFDNVDFALEYCYYMNCLFNAQAIKRQDVFVNALAGTKVLIKAGGYDINSLDKYLANKMFMKKTSIRVITPVDVFDYISIHKPERVINIEEGEYSFLEILKLTSRDKWSSIDFYLQRFYNTDIRSLIHDLEYMKKKRQ
jgi:hypothetical protein